MGGSRVSPGGFVQKELCSYDPNALRSRLPVDFGDQSKPYVRFCKPRNVSGFEITDPNLGHTDAGRFKTINKVFHNKLDPGQGSANAGIMAEKATTAREAVGLSTERIVLRGARGLYCSYIAWAYWCLHYCHTSGSYLDQTTCSSLVTAHLRLSFRWGQIQTTSIAAR